MLLLFDIDGTLVTGASRAHAACLVEALDEVHGVHADRAALNVSAAGRTDGEIARLILLGLGVSAERIDERAVLVREACCRRYGELGDVDLSSAVVPGIPDVLTWLSGVDSVRLGLVTGNYEPIARMKLARAGLASHFSGCPGAYGSDSEDRMSLPPIARRRAGTAAEPYPREQTIVIGDTPRDIACARADDLRCVAVATGPFGVDQLEGADAAVGDATALRRALAELIT